MNWIEKFRLHQNFFNENDNLKEILRFIINHDILLGSGKENTRHAKINSILNGEKYEDPLDFLNPIIDIINGKIEKTMDQPTYIINYIDDSNQLQQKYIRTGTINFSNLNEFEEFITNKLKDGYKIYPYTIMQENNKYVFRSACIILI
jgi:hypothetical protein